MIFIFDTDFEKRKYLSGVFVNFFADFIDLKFTVKFVFFRMKINEAQRQTFFGIVKQVDEQRG